MTQYAFWNETEARRIDGMHNASQAFFIKPWATFTCPLGEGSTLELIFCICTQRRRRCLDNSRPGI